MRPDLWFSWPQHQGQFSGPTQTRHWLALFTPTRHHILCVPWQFKNLPILTFVVGSHKAQFSAHCCSLPFGSTRQKYQVFYHSYADDTSQYDNLNSINNLINCISYTKPWMAQNCVNELIHNRLWHAVFEIQMTLYFFQNSFLLCFHQLLQQPPKRDVVSLSETKPLSCTRH